jgi:hypothetical protein
MLTITNRKVAGLGPDWAPFRGLSLLFDNPGDSFNRNGCRLDLTLNLADPTLVFYRLLHESVVRLGKDHLLHTYLFCCLPPASYHVTAWDGINDGNLDEVPQPHQATLQSLLAGLPDSLFQLTSLVGPLLPSARAPRAGEVRFRFQRLGNWSNTSVVAELAPADEESVAALQRLVGLRATWTESFQARFGISPSGPHFAPHVTLGYFGNRDLAAQMQPLQGEWSAILAETMRSCVLPLSEISLYGFTDMATFFKLQVPH